MSHRAKLKIGSKIFLLLLVSAFLFWPHKAQMLPQLPEKDSDLSVLAPPKSGDRKMESVLFQLLDIQTRQGLEKAEEFARRNAIEFEDGNVRVVVEGEKNGLPGIKTQNIKMLSLLIESSGGLIETTYGNLIQGRIPILYLQELKNYATVDYIRLPMKPISTAVISEGVSKVGATEWQAVEPYRTDETVKVCILDLGFTGYTSLLGSELPPSVVTRSFRSDGDLFVNVHGTACAEIVYDMAPNAELYLVNFGTDVEHHQAVDWIISQGVDIVSYSIAWANMGAGDGTGPICEDVEKASSAGIIWAKSAGNDAERHWTGTWDDPDNDGWHNFWGVDEIFYFYGIPYQVWSLYLNWDDWGTWDGSSYSGSNQDYDLYILYYDGVDWWFAGWSTNIQSGWQWPVEAVAGWSTGYVWWGIALHKYSATRDVKFDMRIWGNTSYREYNSPEESLTIPADSLYCYAVGATDWSDDSLHSYSSRGPTKDGRTKPDFCAPSGVSTDTYGYLDFFGTSASAPHFAGAVALLKEKTPLTSDEIIEVLRARALDLGDPGPDNLYGYYGRLKLK